METYVTVNTIATAGKHNDSKLSFKNFKKFVK